MTATAEQTDLNLTPTQQERRDRAHARITRAGPFLDIAALSWLTPILRLCYGDTWQNQRGELMRTLLLPVIAFGAFIALWQVAYMTMVTVEVKTNFWSDELQAMVDEQEFRTHAIPSPAQTGVRWVELITGGKWGGYGSAPEGASQAEIDQFATTVDRQKSMFSQASGYYWDSIFLSLFEVFVGFLIGALIAIPLGIFAGLSKYVQAALGPFIQIFRPVSPVAWLLVVQLFTIYFIGGKGVFGLAASTIQVIFVVALCSLWPTLINTALGVRSIDRDLMNVSDVLQLNAWKRVTKLILPSALPVIFAGLRVGLGVGWMVLIAAEALAQSSGLGLFMWNLYQNGDANSMVSVMVTVFTIGVIGFMLDRIMVVLQAAVSHDGTARS